MEILGSRVLLHPLDPARRRLAEPHAHLTDVADLRDRIGPVVAA